MPLWIIYHPPNAFTTPSSKKALAAGITEIYTSSAGLPAFYVNIFFQSIETSSFYIGGVSRPSPDKDANGNERPLIRITIQHIARTLDNDTMRDNFLAAVDRVLKPHIADQGYDWEYSVYETRRDLWKVQGMVPPMPNSKAEKEWVRLNRATEFEKEDGGL